MRRDQEPPRTTTTIRRRPEGRRRFFALIATAAVLLFGAYVAGAEVVHLGADDAATECAGDCQPESATVAQVAPLLNVAGGPCPYCNQDADRWRLLTTTAPPQIGGHAAVVMEGACGSLIYGLNEHERLPPASLAKIATALVAVDLAKLSDRVPIRFNGWDLTAEDGSSIMGIEAGMNLSVEELLYGLLLPSGNDAAIALAEHLGGTARFVGLMNERALKLGLRNTQFTNPDGRHDNNLYSTAFDMAVLGREIMSNPKLREIAGTQRFTPNWNRHELWNANYLLYIYEGAIGVKTGYTEEANSTIVAAAERNGRTLYASALGSWDPYWDALRLLDWAFKNTQPTCGR